LNVVHDFAHHHYHQNGDVEKKSDWRGRWQRWHSSLRLKVSPLKRADRTTRAIAERIREERDAERFSQYELAAELGLTRAALASFELARNPLPFSSGWEFCRRLDICPRWLATGQEPRRPCPPPEELGIDPADLKRQMRRGVRFSDGYAALLSEPLEEWVRQNPTEKLIERQLTSGPGAVARRLSRQELVTQLRSVIPAMAQEKNEHQRRAYAEVANAMLLEIAQRLSIEPAKIPSKRRKV
jgi:transcriptional regulator with XRE-family HTH domain